MKRNIFHITVFCLLTFVLLGCKSNNTFKYKDRKQLFNYDWKFQSGDVENAKTTNFDDRNWRVLDLPHDWSIEGIVDVANTSGNDGGYYPTGLGWYRKTFTVPEDWENKKVSIYFEGVYMNSEVFINGNSLGIQPYGYTSFNYDLSPYLEYGKDNVVAVKVDNSQQKNSRWYSGSGIYRNVWLNVTNKLHISHWGMAITTPEVSKNKATVNIKTLIKNETSLSQKIELNTLIQNEKGNYVTEVTTEVELGANQEVETIQDVFIENPALWSPDAPNLYQAKMTIKNGDATIDIEEKYFGVRSIVFSPENGFVLNGEKVIINGGCVHHDNGALGAAAYNRAEERKVELLKKGGFNAVRTSHNPPSEAFLEACDRLGLLVVDEAFDGWKVMKTPHDYAKYFNDWWKHDLQSMVKRDINHPSIIMWSIGNEIIERTDPQAVETAKMLAAGVKEIDTTRPVTSAMTTWGQGWEIFDPLMEAHDVAGYNYQLHYAESDHERVPSRIIVNTESYPKNAFFIWNLVQKHDYIIGDFVWTAMDYLGESGIGRYYYYPEEPIGEHWERLWYPWHGAYCGDIDLTGWRKPISHYRSMLYNNDEDVYLAVKEPSPENSEIRLTMWAVWPTWESWTWPGQEGKNLEVEVYSKHEKVRLYLNNELIGEKPTTVSEEFKTTFSVPYAAGELKAVAVKDGEEVGESILKTVGDASKIKLTADRNIIVADGQDLAYVTVEITDKNGDLNPNANHRLEFKLDGPGTILAVDNANLKDTDPYIENNREAWNGRALVIIKSTKDKGIIELEATAEGLEPATCKIQTE